jgi:hypothetical protein
MRGLAQPSTEVVKVCLVPRVWVLGFWFCSTLRCIALLCTVCVRLHFVLLPVGGLFLLSLSVIYFESWAGLFLRLSMYVLN